MTEERRQGYIELSQAIGRLEGTQDALKTDVADIKKDMKAVADTLSQARGGWKAFLAVSTLSGFIGATAATIIQIIPR